MNDRFDELTKSMAQSVTRRGALTKFGLGLAGIALASLGLAGNAKADRSGCKGSGHLCKRNEECCSGGCVSFDSNKGRCL